MWICYQMKMRNSKLNSIINNSWLIIDFTGPGVFLAFFMTKKLSKIIIWRLFVNYALQTSLKSPLLALILASILPPLRT